MAAHPGLAGGARAGRDPLVVLLLVLVVARLAVALVAVDRGFELGDEGYFLLNLNQPEAALPPHEIYRLLGALSGGAQVGVVGARLLRIAVELAGSLALVAGVLHWARRRLFPQPAAPVLAPAAFALQGGLLSVASRSLGYNDLTNLFSYTAVGALFALAATRPPETHRRLALAAGAGLLTGLQLATKFPTAGLLAVLVAWLVGFALPIPARGERLRVLAGYAGGVLAVVLLVAAATGGPDALAERLAVAARLPTLTGYDPGALLARYLFLEQLTILNLGVFLLAFVAALALARVVAGRARGGTGGSLDASGDARLALAVVVASLALLAGLYHDRPNFLHPSLVVLACFVIGTGLALLAIGPRRAVRRDGAGASERLSLLGALLVLPLFAIAGTNVPVTMRLPTHVLPLFVLLAVLVFERRPSPASWLARATAGVLVAITTVVFAYHHWLRPYGLRAPIHGQTFSVAGLDGVRVDYASARFLERVARVLAEGGFQPGDPLLALDYMPGLVYFAGGTSPRWNLYMFDQPAYDCFNLMSARFERPPFLILARDPGPVMQRCLEKVAFPEAYQLLQTLRFPYDEVYVSFGAHDFTHVRIYGPRPASGWAAPDAAPYDAARSARAKRSRAERASPASSATIP